VANYDAMLHTVIKIVGTSADHEAVARCEASIQTEFGTRVTAARSQPYYLDVTHPDANKGAIVRRLAKYLNVPPRRIATIGDQMNDTLMFRESGLSIAMGNASPDVQRLATFVTTSFGEEGFANAVERFILPRAQLWKAR
jgi:hydroxymethylpyrimidine pyrophosphatase-like HAD family hydrolase